MENKLIMIGIGNNILYMDKEFFNKPKKRVIRKNIFESNSSSSHSIVITKNDHHVTEKDLTALEINGECNHNYIFLNNDGKMWLWNIDEGFGRSFYFLTTFEEKLQYAMCEYLGYMYGDEDEFIDMLDTFKAIVKDVLPGFTDFDIPMIEKDVYLDEKGNQIPYKKLKYVGDKTNENGDWISRYNYIDENGNVKEAILDMEYVIEVPDIGMIDHQSVGLLRNFLREKEITLKEFLINKKYVVITDSDETCQWEKLKQSGIFDINSSIVEEYSTSNDDIEYQKWKEMHKDEEITED